MPTQTEIVRRRKQDEEDDLFLLFAALMSGTHEALSVQCRHYLQGVLPLSALSDALVAVLGGAFLQSAVLGHTLAGMPPTPNGRDVELAASAMTEQEPYLHGLVSDMESGRYELTDDGELPGSLESRLSLYSQRLRGAANTSWVQSLPSSTLIYWRLSEDADHCESCLGYAAGSPYRADELPTTPGSAECQCLSACRCRIEIADGRSGFPLDMNE